MLNLRCQSDVVHHSERLWFWAAASKCSMQMLKYQRLVLRLSSCLHVCPWLMSRLLLRWRGLSGRLGVWPSPAMAVPYFPTFLLLIFLSSLTLLLLICLPSINPSLPLASWSHSSPWLEPSCGPGQSWAVRIHDGLQPDGEDGEEDTVHLDVLAERVKYFISLSKLKLFF